MGPDFHICLVVFATFCFEMCAQAGQRRCKQLQFWGFMHCNIVPFTYIAWLWPIGDCDIEERRGVNFS